MSTVMLAFVVIILTCTLQHQVYGQDILISDKSFSVRNGDQLVLDCADRDLSLLQGTVNVTWFKDGVTIPDEDPRVNAVADDTLLLAQVRQKDAGTYICTAEATGFQSTSTTRLFVIGNDPPNSVTSASSVTTTSVTQISSSTSNATPTSVIPASSVTTTSATQISSGTSNATPRSVTPASSVTTTSVTQISSGTSNATPRSVTPASSVTTTSVTQISSGTSNATPRSVTPASSVTTIGVTQISSGDSSATPRSVTPASSVTTIGVTQISSGDINATPRRVTSARSVATTNVTDISSGNTQATLISVTTSTNTMESVSPSSVNTVSHTTATATKQASPTDFLSPRTFIQITSNRVSGLQLQVEAISSGDHSTNISTVITELANLTKPGNELKLNAIELSSSVDVLVQLVTYNFLENNSAINTAADQRNVLEVASNLLEEENTRAWLLLQENRENITDVLLKTLDEFGAQVSSRLGDSVNSTSFVLLSRNIAFRVDRLNSKQMLNVDFSEYGTTFLVPGSVFSVSPGSRVSTIVYRTLHNVFRLGVKGSSKVQHGGESLEKTGSSIISATVIPRPTSPLRNPVKLVFNRNNKSGDLIGQCVFWELGQSQRTWLTRGCVRVDRESNARVTTCECDHLTIFAVLLNNKPVKAHHQLSLKYISTIGCACSLLFLLLTFAVIALSWKQVKSTRVIMLLNLCAAITASCLLIILADYAREPEVLCTIAAAFLHYFLLCVFSWMLCHGVVLYFLIIRVELRENLKTKMKWFYALGWGFPLPIVAVSLIVTGTKTYAANNCWLTTENGIIYWTFVAPAAIIILINSVLLVFLLRRINRATKFKQSMTRAKNVKAWLRRSAMLLPILGVTWSFGFLTFISPTVVFHYIFTILNSLQGLFIFVDFCILDDSFKESIVSTLCKRNATSPNEQSELTIRQVQAVRRSTAPQTQTAVFNTTKTNGSQQHGFHDLTNNTKDSERHTTKIQTWMTAGHL